nr:MAG TPA: hypothetical protein [Caudoviricetes sp.]
MENKIKIILLFVFYLSDNKRENKRKEKKK